MKASLWIVRTHGGGSPPPFRDTQTFAEVIVSGQPALRDTQTFAEVIVASSPDLHNTQTFAEVIVS